MSTAARHSIKEPAQGHWTVGCRAICKRTNIHTDKPNQRAQVIPQHSLKEGSRWRLRGKQSVPPLAWRRSCAGLVTRRGEKLLKKNARDCLVTQATVLMSWCAFSWLTSFPCTKARWVQLELTMQEQPHNFGWKRNQPSRTGRRGGHTAVLSLVATLQMRAQHRTETDGQFAWLQHDGPTLKRCAPQICGRCPRW